MTVEYTVLGKQGQELYVKCFYNGQGYGEFYMLINLRTGTVRFCPKDPTYAQVLIAAFHKAMTAWQ